MHMICICKWRLPGCDRNKHNKIFSTAKTFPPKGERETLKFVWRLACSKLASPGRTVDLHTHTVRPRPPHLLVLLPPHQPSLCQSRLRGIPTKGVTQICLPFLPPSPRLALMEGNTSHRGGDGTLSPEWGIAEMEGRKRDLSTQASRDAPHPLLVSQALSMCFQFGVSLWRALGGG